MKKVMYLCILLTAPKLYPMEPIDLEYQLFQAVKKKDYTSTATYLKMGADPNSPRYETCEVHSGKETPLDHAILIGNFDICKLLLEHGANPNIRNYKNGLHPLEKASRNYKITLLLINYGVDTKIWSPLLEAIAFYDLPSCQLFVQSGTPLTYPDLYGNESSIFAILSEPHYKLTQEKKIKIITTILENANFTPFLCDHEFKKFLDSYNRIGAALMVFRRLCPTIPKDLKKHTLHTHLREDFERCSWFGKLSIITEKNCMNYPGQLIGMLITRKKLDPKNAVSILTGHANNQIHRELQLLKKIEWDAYYSLKHYHPYSREKVEYNIRKRLGLVPWYEKAYDALPNNPCVVQ